MAQEGNYIREKEAATYLGISTQTLYRLRSKGTLPYREKQGTTRPSIEYALVDLDRLKADLAKKRTRSRKPQELQASPPRVNFGLPPHEFDELSREAERFGMSPNEYARRLMREGLESRFQAEAAELRAEMKKSVAELRKMRSEFSAGFEAVLEFIGLPPDQARQWVTDNLR
nr:helix-turn-helix domain-containing protein [Armatimonas sp.]